MAPRSSLPSPGTPSYSGLLNSPMFQPTTPPDEHAASRAMQALSGLMHAGEQTWAGPSGIRGASRASSTSGGQHVERLQHVHGLVRPRSARQRVGSLGLQKEADQKAEARGTERDREASHRPGRARVHSRRHICRMSSRYQSLKVVADRYNSLVEAIPGLSRAGGQSRRQEERLAVGSLERDPSARARVQSLPMPRANF